MLAALPMYDWDGVRPSTDAFWAAIRTRLRAGGLEAPGALTRPFAESDWLNPGLRLAQTCGMPFRLHLHGRVSLIGTPDYGVEGCPPGYYRSVIVTAGGAPAGTAAVNSRESQSGWAALLGCSGMPADVLLTGSHAASIRAVAEGRAGFAAIDAVTWRHALRDMPEARDLTVAKLTRPTPGLPLICAPGLHDPGVFGMIEAAIDDLNPTDRDALFLCGLVRTKVSDYLA